MSNYTIKAKNKKTGEVINVRYEKGFTRFDGYGYAVLNDTVCVDVLSEQEFNDLFEVVEDKDHEEWEENQIREEHERGDYVVVETGDDKFSIAYVTLKTDMEDWEEVYDRLLTGVNIPKSDFDKLKRYINKTITQEIAKAKEEERIRYIKICLSLYENWERRPESDDSTYEHVLEKLIQSINLIKNK